MSDWPLRFKTGGGKRVHAGRGYSTMAGPRYETRCGYEYVPDRNLFFLADEEDATCQVCVKGLEADKARQP